MQILAVAGIVGAFALICVAIYFFGRYLQRRGHDLSFVDPRYPDSMQQVQAKIPPPGTQYPNDDQQPDHR